MALVFANIAFRYVFIWFFDNDSCWFFVILYIVCKPVLINLTLKGQRYQHIPALFAIVQKSKFGDSILSMCVCKKKKMCIGFLYVNCVLRFGLVKTLRWPCAFDRAISLLGIKKNRIMINSFLIGVMKQLHTPRAIDSWSHSWRKHNVVHNSATRFHNTHQSSFQAQQFWVYTFSRR